MKHWIRKCASFLLFKKIHYLPHHMACGILVKPGTESKPPAWEAWGLNSWTAREVSPCLLIFLTAWGLALKCIYIIYFVNANILLEFNNKNFGPKEEKERISESTNRLVWRLGMCTSFLACPDSLWALTFLLWCQLCALWDAPQDGDS